MKRLTHLILAALASVMVLGGAALPASASHSFSSQGLDDVLAAAAAKKPADMTTNEFAAVILAVTWPEAAGNSINAPSPMTMGRADISQRLYAWSQNNVNNPYKRAFFHAGIGAWQLDSAGFASGLTTAAMISTYSAANVVASEMARRWSVASGTKQQKRAYVWQPWYACANSKCENIFQEIYNATNDTLNVTRNPYVSRYGGGVWKTCNYPGQASTFSCFEVNPANAQGWTGSWRYAPYDGAYDASGAATRPSPLTQTFYNYAAGGYEYRVWLRKDTTYQIHVGSYRPLGQNARTSLVWFQSNGLCVNGVCP